MSPCLRNLTCKLIGHSRFLSGARVACSRCGVTIGWVADDE